MFGPMCSLQLMIGCSCHVSTKHIITGGQYTETSRGPGKHCHGRTRGSVKKYRGGFLKLFFFTRIYGFCCGSAGSRIWMQSFTSLLKSMWKIHNTQGTLGNDPSAGSPNETLLLLLLLLAVRASIFLPKVTVPKLSHISHNSLHLTISKSSSPCLVSSLEKK